MCRKGCCTVCQLTLLQVTRSSVNLTADITDLYSKSLWKGSLGYPTRLYVGDRQIQATQKPSEWVAGAGCECFPGVYKLVHPILGTAFKCFLFWIGLKRGNVLFRAGEILFIAAFQSMDLGYSAFAGHETGSLPDTLGLGVSLSKSFILTLENKTEIGEKRWFPTSK